MKNILSAFYARPIASYLIAALLVISSLSGPAQAMHIPTALDASQAAQIFDRAADIAKVQKALETKELQQRLLDYGLTPDETTSRIDRLSDDQLHHLASNLDAVQAGGDALGAILGLAIIALLVVLIIFLLEGRIEIRKK